MVAYEPSARRDSGMTRSNVRGSIAIPEADCWGKSGGLDMMIVLVRCSNCDKLGMTGTGQTALSSEIQWESSILYRIP
jgi:hypothetical protein